MRVFIKTYGCSFNHADSENMAGLLQDTGRYEIVDNEELADIVVINSCTVKNSAEQKFWRDVENIGKLKVLAGCVPQATKDKSKFKDFPVVGTTQITSVVDVVDAAIAGEKKQALQRRHQERLNIPKIRKNKVIEILPINEGCLSSCNFCMTKFARGHLSSYAPEDILRQARASLNDGAKEIWLTSQDTACYGYDIDTNIVELLNILFEMKREFRVRLGMGNPDYLPDYLDDLLNIYEDKRLYRFMHIPVQAGSDHTLEAMNRKYTVDTFMKIVHKVKSRFPDMTLATDIICGYPDETDDDFEKTMELIKQTRPDVINISRFWPRPGTLAAKKHPLPTSTVKARSTRLHRLAKRLSKENNEKWLGWQGKVLVNQQGKKGTMMARNYAYKPIAIKQEIPLGEEVEVKIVRANTYHLVGEIVTNK